MTELGKIKTGSSMSFLLTSSRCHPLFLFQLLALTLMVGLATMASSCFAFTASSSRSVSKCRHRLSHLHLKSDGLTPEEREVKVGKAMKAMTAFTNTYLKKTETTLCQEKSIAAVVIKGLAEHKGKSLLTFRCHRIFYRNFYSELHPIRVALTMICSFGIDAYYLYYSFHSGLRCTFVSLSLLR